MGDHQHVAVAEAQPGSLQGVAKDAGEIVARPNRRDAWYRRERDCRGLWRHQGYPKRTSSRSRARSGRRGGGFTVSASGCARNEAATRSAGASP